MVIQDRFLTLYRRLRLLSYRRLLRRAGKLTIAEAFSADIIHLMGRPTVTEFAGIMGITQPSATYKVNNLSAKGVIRKLVSARDRRECRLQAGDNYRRHTLESPGMMEAVLQKLSRRFTPEELSTTASVLDALITELEQEEEIQK